PASNAAAKPTPFMLMQQRMEPDLTVITGDGRKFRAHLIGLDGETGLTILQLMGTMPAPPPPRPNTVAAGQGVEIFSPEPVPGTGEALTGTTYVKIGRTDATLVNVGLAVSP